MPKEIVFPVTVEVAGPHDAPWWTCKDGADLSDHRRTAHNLLGIHKPDLCRVVRTAEENIGLPVTVEVTDCHDAPWRTYRGWAGFSDRCRPATHLRAIHQPELSLVRRTVEPLDVHAHIVLLAECPISTLSFCAQCLWAITSPGLGPKSGCRSPPQVSTEKSFFLFVSTCVGLTCSHLSKSSSRVR